MGMPEEGDHRVNDLEEDPRNLNEIEYQQMLQRIGLEAQQMEFLDDMDDN